MYEFNDILELFFGNIKKLFFPEDWLQIDLKFSKSEIFAMLLVDRKKEITMTELADYINVSMSTANGIIERLVKKGYVKRDRSDSDRRIVVLQLTEEGSQLVLNLKEFVSRYLKMALEELTEEEVQSLIDIVLKIMRGLQRKTDKDASAKPAESEIRKIPIE